MPRTYNVRARSAALVVSFVTLVGGPAVPVAAQDNPGGTPVNRRVLAKILNVDECRPKYPPESLQANEAGTTVVWLRIAADGAVMDASLSRSSGHHRLDDTAVQALSRCRFSPGTFDGQAVESATTISYRWRIEPPKPLAKGCAPEYPERAGDDGAACVVVRERRDRAGRGGEVQRLPASGSRGRGRPGGVQVQGSTRGRRPSPGRPRACGVRVAARGRATVASGSSLDTAGTGPLSPVVRLTGAVLGYLRTHASVPRSGPRDATLQACVEAAAPCAKSSSARSPHVHRAAWRETEGSSGSG
jgi:TonB family protein